MEYKFLKNIRLPYVKIFNITWAFCVNGIPYVPYVPGFSEIFPLFGVAFFIWGLFSTPWVGRKKECFPDAFHQESKRHHCWTAPPAWCWAGRAARSQRATTHDHQQKESSSPTRRWWLRAWFFFCLATQGRRRTTERVEDDAAPRYGNRGLLGPW